MMKGLASIIFRFSRRIDRLNKIYKWFGSEFFKVFNFNLEDFGFLYLVLYNSVNIVFVKIRFKRLKLIM